MEIEDHYKQLLGIESPWEIHSVDLNLDGQRVDITIEYTDDEGHCPECGAVCARYDVRQSRTGRCKNGIFRCAHN